MSVNTTGIAITSSSISGTCLILSRARQPKAADAAQAPGGSGRGPGCRPGGSASGEVAGTAVVMTFLSWFAVQPAAMASAGGGRGAGPGGCRGWLAGQGHEHLVQAGLAQGELSDGDARAAELGERGRRLVAGRPSLGSGCDRGG